MADNGIAPVYAIADDYLDGGIEERAWVPVALAATPDEAVSYIAASDWSDSVKALAAAGMRIVATGARSWHRMAGCGRCEGSGVEQRWTVWVDDEPSVFVGPLPVCRRCEGSGEQDPEEGDGDGVAWDDCEADSPGAVEFWDLEVTDSDPSASGEPEHADPAGEALLTSDLDTAPEL